MDGQGGLHRGQDQLLGHLALTTAEQGTNRADIDAEIDAFEVSRRAATYQPGDLRSVAGGFRLAPGG